LIIKANSIQTISDAAFTSDKNRCVMFSKWDKALNQLSVFHYDSVKKFELYPIFGISEGDSILTYNLITNTGSNAFYGSLRLYDNNDHIIKEAVINKNLRQEPYSCLRLSNGNIVASSYTVNSLTSATETSSFFLYDRQLNPITWPVTPPAKGYDWACKGNIPAHEDIYLDAIVTPVHVSPDTSKIDWQWLSVKEPEEPVTTKEENGWIAWPQPAANGTPVHFRATDPEMRNTMQSLGLYLYDMQGNRVSTGAAIFESKMQWVIPSLQALVPGLYLADLTNMYTGISVGKIKIVVK
jgi:hypothetical protein